MFMQGCLRDFMGSFYIEKEKFQPIKLEHDPVLSRTLRTNEPH